MEIHNRLMNLPTTGVTILEILADNPERKSSMIRELVEACVEKIHNCSDDLKILEIFRMILCYEYQSAVNSRIDGCPLESEKTAYVDIRKLFIRDTDCFLKTKEFSLLYDIAVLQLVLRSDERRLVESFGDFYDTQQERLAKRYETKDLCMRVCECFADAYNLRRCLYKGENGEKDLQELCDRVPIVIESWMKQEETLEWKLLASLLPKLVVALGAPKILTPLWDKVLENENDLGKTLAALCVMADACFPSEAQNICPLRYEQCVREEFWSFLLRGLISEIHQLRKQALYLIKRALDFIESHDSEIARKPDSSKENIVLFLRTESPIEEHSRVSAKTNFFLILESLEEKQKHLVLPALTHLPSLVEAYTEQKSRGYGFHVSWLRCIFKRILRHDNRAIKIIGLREILRADLNIYDEDFLYFLAKTLNDTLLYECNEDNEAVPEIVGQLQEFFSKSETNKMSLINGFVREISRVSWCPVAIYWILKALVGVKKLTAIVHNVWTLEEMKCVKNLIDKNLTKYCEPSRISSQALILEAFCVYIQGNLDLSLIEAAIDIVFSAREALHLFSIGLITECFTKNVKPSQAELYVTRTCETQMKKKNIESFALTIVILLDSCLLATDLVGYVLAKDCQGIIAINELFENLISANSRPYADRALFLKALELVSHIMRLSGSLHAINVRTDWLISGYKQAIWEIIEGSFRKTGITSFDEYLNALNALKLYDNFIEDRKAIVVYSECINIITNPEKISKYHWLYALKVLHVCRDLWRPALYATYIRDMLKYFKNEILNERKKDSGESKDDSRGRFISDCCEYVSLIVEQYVISASPGKLLADIQWLEELLRLVEIGTERVIVSVAGTLVELLVHPQSMSAKDVDIFNSIIRLSWRSSFQLNKTEVFFAAIKNLTRLIFNSQYLKLDGAKEIAIECANQLMEEGKSVPSLKKIFIEEMALLSEKEILQFQKPFVSCLLHGQVPRQDQRIEQATMSHCTFISDRFGGMDNKIRACSVAVLLAVLKKSKGSKSELRESILRDLLLILEKNRDKRYHDNSYLHRLKHRTMQTLLILEPFLSENERQIILRELSIAEGNLPSVRLMGQWLLVRIYANNFSKQESMWKLLEAQRPASIIFIASVAFHVSRLLEGKIKIDFIAETISHLLPNCMSQKFTVRLYSQTILVKIYEMLPRDCPEAKEHRGIYDCVKESLRCANLAKNSQNLIDDFYFTVFDPYDDYNFEIIYHEFPRVTGLFPDEWIRISRFYDLDIEAQHPLFNKTGWDDRRSVDWEPIKVMNRPQRSMGELGEATESTIDGGLSDIQKKIIPWKSMIPLSDELSEISSISRRKIENDDSGIIVIASLIDRPPNLGGIARTCEIFGAKELVIGSLSFANDPEFKTLSVSAEKWLTITEVKPHLLKIYLLEQQSKGWKLIGAEQTANSTNLLEMKFDKKTILLLGNEKSGIPANLIPILDTCVEIPQSGVVRSLNVHVTGAICIWQYAKQHILA